jgi:hypothetical protein
MAEVEGEAMNTNDLLVLADQVLLHDALPLAHALLHDALPLAHALLHDDWVFYTYLLTQGTAMACGHVFYNTYIVGSIKWGKPPYRQYGPAHNASYILFCRRHNRLYKTFFAG